MTYEKVKKLKPEEFKRLCGVRPETFTQMVKLVEKQTLLKKKIGRPSRIKLRKSSFDECANIYADISRF